MGIEKLVRRGDLQEKERIKEGCTSPKKAEEDREEEVEAGNTFELYERVDKGWSWVGLSVEEEWVWVGM